MDKTIFREYDIRGEYPTQIDEEAAYTIGRSYGSYIQEKLKRNICGVGRDNRLSSPSLSKELIRGIIDSGCNVIDFGLTTTPMYYYACKKSNVIIGVMVTASHNPKDDNGFKFSFDNLGNARGEQVYDFRDYTFGGKFLEGHGEISYFDPKEYSVIVLDECHRSGAESYQKIINYFEPELLLGMSASPERTDDFDVFKLFDHNIACEVRLQQALENDMLCPFHYFGITDLEIEGEENDDLSRFRYLTSDKRVKYILERAEYYGFSGDRVKGLIFCSRKEEARELSDKFNQTGRYSTIMLSGDDSQQVREDAIERLVSDSRKDRLDYIFTVDIFNEGVDVPEINQVILLRPTESPIIFVQQLGRGLRKAEGKEFVIVLDFIGNYQTNYMIPIALSGDRTGNKDNIRRSLMEGNNIIKGASTIYFDEISRDRI